MPILEQLIGAGASSILNSVGGVWDKFITTDEQKLKAKQEICGYHHHQITEVASFQRDVLVTEMQGSALQAQLAANCYVAFAFIIVFHYFLQPLISHWYPVPDIEFANAVLEFAGDRYGWLCGRPFGRKGG